MEQAVKTNFLRLSAISLGTFMLCGLILAASSAQFLPEFTVSFGLTYLFVAGNFAVVRYLDVDDNKKFYRLFFISIVLRFLLVLGALVFVLKTINFHQIFFTVSFIISYIFHSVNEIIFINKILETDRKR